MLRLLVGLLLVALATFVAPASVADEHRLSEYEVKAAFLYNFANFVEWPAVAFPDPKSPLVIGILGDDPFGEALAQIVTGERIDGRELMIRHSDRPADLAGSHMLFTTWTEETELASALRELGDRHVLTVGEADGFTRLGGVIGFVVDDNRVRFEINMKAAERANLSCSAQLQKVAARVVNR